MALTEEDKAWLQQNFATSINALEARLDAKLGDLEARFEDKLAQAEIRFMASLERVETRLLTEFHKWASPMEARQRSHAAAVRAIDDRDGSHRRHG